MPSQYERDEAVRRATGMLGGGFDTNYIYEKLLAENFSEEQAAAIIQEVTGQAFVKAIKAESRPSEAPLSFAPQAEAPKMADDAPVSLASLLATSSTNTQNKRGESSSEFLDTLDEKLEEAQEDSDDAYLPEEESSLEAAAVSSTESNKLQNAYRSAEAKNLAASLFNSGYGFEYIQNKLRGRGFSEGEVNAAIAPLKGKNSFMKSASDKSKPDYRYAPQTSGGEDGSSQVIIGIVMILIGCGVTFFSFQAAANNPSGGMYIVTFGLIIAGAVRVFRGLSNS
jgi:hypothetical protein